MRGYDWKWGTETLAAAFISTAAKTAKLWMKHPQMSVEELVCLPEADDIEISKVKDFEVMDGLF